MGKECIPAMKAGLGKSMERGNGILHGRKNKKVNLAGLRRMRKL